MRKGKRGGGTERGSGGGDMKDQGYTRHRYLMRGGSCLRNWKVGRGVAERGGSVSVSVGYQVGVYTSARIIIIIRYCDLYNARVGGKEERR